MSGYQTYTRFQRIEAQARQLGFRLGNPRTGSWGSNDGQDFVTLYPDGESLPIWTRDADIFTGTFSQVETFLTGWARAQQYDMLLRVSDEKRRKKYEEKERERQCLEKERLEKKKMFAILANKEESEVDKLIK